MLAGTELRGSEGGPLPGYEFAVIPEGKLRGYALNPEHETGKHKARVFRSALGFQQQDWRLLHDQIMEGLPESEAILRNETAKWQNWTVPILVPGRNSRRGYVTTGWVVKADNERPQLTTAYVEDSQRNRKLLAASEPFHVRRVAAGTHSSGTPLARGLEGANKVQTSPTPFRTTTSVGETPIFSNRAKSTDSATPHDTPKMGS